MSSVLCNPVYLEFIQFIFYIIFLRRKTARVTISGITFYCHAQDGGNNNLAKWDRSWLQLNQQALVCFSSALDCYPFIYIVNLTNNILNPSHFSSSVSTALELVYRVSPDVCHTKNDILPIFIFGDCFC